MQAYLSLISRTPKYLSAKVLWVKQTQFSFNLPRQHINEIISVSLVTIFIMEVAADKSNFAVFWVNHCFIVWWISQGWIIYLVKAFLSRNANFGIFLWKIHFLNEKNKHFRHFTIIICRVFSWPCVSYSGTSYMDQNMKNKFIWKWRYSVSKKKIYIYI